MTMYNPPHPGEIILDSVEYLGLTVTDAAEALGVSRVTLSRVMHGHAAISANLAIRLEAAGISTARMWLDMQAAHDLWQAKAAGIPTVRRLGPVAESAAQ